MPGKHPAKSSAQRTASGRVRSRGLLISLEGADGAGKSTQHRLLVRYLRGRGRPVVATREPGGTPLGERVRRILLATRSKGIAPLAELALMYAARAQHLEQVIRPALARGALVVTDRFNDSSFAYQGCGRELGFGTVRAFDNAICGDTQPDLTLLLDQPPNQSLGRAKGRERAGSSVQARFERQGIAFHERVRAGYLKLARANPGRIKIVNANRPVREIQQEIRAVVDGFLGARSEGRASGR